VANSFFDDNSEIVLSTKRSNFQNFEELKLDLKSFMPSEDDKVSKISKLEESFYSELQQERQKDDKEL
jgi:hypothetical protein